MSAVREVCPETKGAFENIGLPAGTMTRRTEEMSEDFKQKFQGSLSVFTVILLQWMKVQLSKIQCNQKYLFGVHIQNFLQHRN